MGTFMGHVVPGTFFTCFGVWWLYNVFYRYFYSRRFHSSYKNQSQYTCACAGTFPIESLFKVVAVSIGLAGEFITGFEDGHWEHMGNAQHMTMFFFFGLNGIVDILQYKKLELPPKLDYISAAIAFGIEGFLFYNHLMGSTMLDVMVHMFLVYTVTACLVSTLMEMQNPSSVLVGLSRVFFVLLQGTWFFQIGFILHSPFGTQWDDKSHGQMMVVTLMYTWHVGGWLVLMGIIGTLIYWRVQNVNPRVTYHMVETKDNLYINSNGRVKISGDGGDEILEIDSETDL